MTAGLLLVIAWIVWTDMRTFTIPDGAVLALLVLACGLRWSAAAAAAATPVWVTLSLVSDAALPGIALWLVRELHYRRRGFDGLGFGDVKLAFAGGALVGPIGFADALFVASVVALLSVAIKVLVVGPVRKGDKIAFGAALAPALGAVWLWQSASALPVATG